MTYRFLIVDGYDLDGRAKLDGAGCTPASELYERMVLEALPGCEIFSLHAADADARLPVGLDLTAFDALLWTGSSLTIYDDIPEVTRQIDLARAAFAAGVPSFGSCWALQIATVAAGGSCRLNPNGREFGVTRKVRLTLEGASHPLYRGKPPAFDAFTSHFDDVESLPSHSVVLATNEATQVQAAVITCSGTSFWAVQYHPEYDFREIAALARLRAEGLLGEGRFDSRQDFDRWVADLDSLHEDPQRLGPRWRLGIDSDLVDVAIRRLEFRNWADSVLSGRQRPAPERAATKPDGTAELENIH
jgi:GMP synthase (glutamine-hydrolysing)